MPDVTQPSEVCIHPHKDRGTEWLRNVPHDPLPHPVQLVLVGTEIGFVPYCGIDNRRALAASTNLVDRLKDARLISGAIRTDWPSPEYGRYDDECWEFPHLVISGALAAHEDRLCIARWCRQQIAERQAQ